MTIKFNGVRVIPSAGGSGGNTVTYNGSMGDSQVSLLLHGDGANNSTTITDNSYAPKTVTAYGNAKISTAQSKFGGASIAFDGNGDYLIFPASSDTDFGSEDMTIEGWIRLNTVSYHTIFNKNGAGASDIGFAIVNSTTIGLGLNNTGGGISRTVPTIQSNVWYHFAIVKSGSDVVLYWNGTQAGAAITGVTSINNNVPYWAIGTDSWNALGYYFNGYLDEFRITKGLARYTSNFTPSATAFPNADGTASLPSSPSVGDVVYSNSFSYVCTSTSPVTWKRFLQSGADYVP